MVAYREGRMHYFYSVDLNNLANIYITKVNRQSFNINGNDWRYAYANDRLLGLIIRDPNNSDESGFYVWMIELYDGTNTPQFKVRYQFDYVAGRTYNVCTACSIRGLETSDTFIVGG